MPLLLDWLRRLFTRRGSGTRPHSEPVAVEPEQPALPPGLAPPDAVSWNHFNHADRKFGTNDYSEWHSLVRLIRTADGQEHQVDLRADGWQTIHPWRRTPHGYKRRSRAADSSCALKWQAAPNSSLVRGKSRDIAPSKARRSTPKRAVRCAVLASTASGERLRRVTRLFVAAPAACDVAARSSRLNCVAAATTSSMPE